MKSLIAFSALLYHLLLSQAQALLNLAVLSLELNQQSNSKKLQLKMIKST